MGHLRLALVTLLLPTAALADGALAGKVDATPARYLTETVIYLRDAKAPEKKAPARTVTIDQKGLRFLPHVVAIDLGDSVEFLNHDQVDHNVFSPDNEGYNLGMIAPSGQSTYRFDKAGVYTQLCSVHAEMLAYVFVGENPYHVAVDAHGAFRLEHLPPGTWKVAVWNSHLKAPDQTVTVVDGKTAPLHFSLTR